MKDWLLPLLVVTALSIPCFLQSPPDLARAARAGSAHLRRRDTPMRQSEHCFQKSKVIVRPLPIFPCGTSGSGLSRLCLTKSGSGTTAALTGSDGCWLMPTLWMLRLLVKPPFGQFTPHRTAFSLDDVWRYVAGCCF